MSRKVNIKMSESLINEARKIAKNKFPLREFETYSNVVREAIIDFIKMNQEWSE